MSSCPTLDDLGGEMLATVTADHVATCRACDVVVELLRERRRAEHARNDRAECARFELLIAARETGVISAAAASLLDQHLQICASCTTIVVTTPPLGRDAPRP